MLRQKINDGKQTTSSAGHFDCPSSVPVQYEAHRPMQHVHGYARSLWMPPSGDYSLRIAPAASRDAGKTRTMKNTPSLKAVLMAAAVRWYNTMHIA
jgi:hypothetical protein